MVDHIYFIQENHRSVSEKRKLQDAKQEWDKRRHEVIINLGVAFSRWKSLRIEKYLQINLKLPALYWTGKSTDYSHG